jgi:hypothetical protein
VDSLIDGIKYKNINGNPLDGTRTISVASILDLGGKSTASNPFLGENLSTFTGITTSVVIDKIAPAPTGLLTIAEATGGLNLVEANSAAANSAAGTQVVVSLNGLTATDGTKPLIGDVLKVNFDGAIIPYTLTLADINAGSVSVTVPTATITAHQGTVTVSATLTDAAGNVSSPASSTTITVDTVAPIQPTFTLGTGVLNGATAAEAAAVGGVVLVTAELGASTVVTFTDGTNSVQVTVTGTGSPQAVALTPTQVATLNNGTITASAVATDVSGNPSSAGTTTFTLDKIAPSAPSAPSVAAQLTNNSVNAAEVLNGTPVVVPLTGTGAQAPVAGDIVNVIIDGVSIAYTLQPLDITNQSATVLVPKSVFDNAAVGQNAASVTATITDIAGNVSLVSPATSIFIDTVAPNQPGILSAPENSGFGINVSEANSASPNRGTPITVPLPAGVSIGDTLTVDLNGTLVTTTLTTLSVTAGNVTLIIPKDTLTADTNQGIQTVKAYVTDAAGNKGVERTIEINIDTQNPDAPDSLVITENDDDGYINISEAANGTVVRVNLNITATDGTQAKEGDVINVNVPKTSGGFSGVAYTLQSSDIGNGYANVTIPKADLDLAGQGSKTIQVSLTDKVGIQGHLIL